MFDVGALSRAVHGAFESTIVVSRDGEADREELGVLHLDGETWDTAGGVAILHTSDAISVAESVDLQRGDTVTCSDTRAVPVSTSWKITESRPGGDDGWIQTWQMRRV